MEAMGAFVYGGGTRLCGEWEAELCCEKGCGWRACDDTGELEEELFWVVGAVIKASRVDDGSGMNDAVAEEGKLPG